MLFLFDFDGVIADQKDGWSRLPDLISIMRKRKSTKSTFEKVVKSLGEKPQVFLNEYFEYLVPNKHFLNVLKMMKRYPDDHSIGIGSDNSLYLITEWLEHTDLTDHFDYIFCPENLSWEWKPNVAYFKKIVKYLNILPSDIVFFDDDVNNIRGAYKVGINAHHYTGGPFSELKKYL